MSYRDDLAALSARYDALSVDIAAKTRELDQARRLLDDAKERARLPVLPNIRVATPCSADWQQMTGDERVRACGQCNKNVYNLSTMTRDEAEALIVEKEGKLCVRYFQRKDGTILLKDCSIGVGQKRKRRLIAAGAAALLAGGGGVLAYKLTRPAKVSQPIVLTVAPHEVVEPHLELKGQLEEVPPDHRVMMGDIDIEPKMGAVAIEPTE